MTQILEKKFFFLKLQKNIGVFRDVKNRATKKTKPAEPYFELFGHLTSYFDFRDSFIQILEFIAIFIQFFCFIPFSLSHFPFFASDTWHGIVASKTGRPQPL